VPEILPSESHFHPSIHPPIDLDLSVLVRGLFYSISLDILLYQMLCASLKVKSLIDSQASSMSFQLDGNFTRNFRGGTTSWSSTQKRSLVKMSRSTPRNTQRLGKEPLSGPKVESRRLFN
jgi:hypothetical protein